MPRESFSCQAELDCAQWPNGQRSGLYRGWFQFNSTRSKESQYLPSLICHLYRIGLSILSFLSKALIIFHPHFHCPSCLLYLFPTAHLRGLSYSPRQPCCLRFHSRISLSLHLSVFNFYCSHFSYLLFIDLWETMDYSGFEHQATRWKAQNDPLSNLWWPSQHLFVKLRIALFFAPFRLSLSFIFLFLSISIRLSSLSLRLSSLIFPMCGHRTMLFNNLGHQFQKKNFQAKY